MALVWNAVAPVFALVALGFWLAGRARRLDLQTISDLTILVTSPALMFSVLAFFTVLPTSSLSAELITVYERGSEAPSR